MGNQQSKPGGTGEEHYEHLIEDDTTSKCSVLTDTEMKYIFTKTLKERYLKQYQAVQPIPYIKDRLLNVNMVFVEGSMEQQYNDTSWKRLDSYKDVFTVSTRETYRRLIEGEPGYGKSTVILQLAYDWCNNVKDSPLHKVDNLILLKLRHVGNIQTIDKAIKLLLLPDEPRIKEDDINYIMSLFDSTEIILDGYDEHKLRDNDEENDIGQIIRNRKYEDVNVTLSTRYPPKEYDKANTQRIRLKGFDEQARNSYISKAVTGPNNETAANKIKQGLKDNPILDDLCQVPLVFVMFAHMTHEKKSFQKFKRVTDFFSYMIKCFHEHERNKSDEKMSKKHFETEFDELSKSAFERVTEEEPMWDKEDMCEQLGEDLYRYYYAIGVLVEEEVYDEDSGEFCTMVRFYHHLFQEWYASFDLIRVMVGDKGKVSQHKFKQAMGNLDPFKLQYLYRFTCGIEPKVGTEIINHLRNTRDGDKLAILCLLETSGRVEDLQEAVRRIFSVTVVIDERFSKLQQRSTMQLLHIASSHGIPISELHLRSSIRGFERDGIRFESGLGMHSLSSIEKISFDGGDNHQLTKEEVEGLLHYGMRSESFKELRFLNCKLPVCINLDSFKKDITTRNIKVISLDEARLFDPEDGKWEKPKGTPKIKAVCSAGLQINNNSSESAQRSVLELLKEAANQNIPIPLLKINCCYGGIDRSGNIFLSSGLSVPILPSLERLHIITEEGRQMGKNELDGIYKCLHQHVKLQTLLFVNCQLPSSIHLGSFASFCKSRNVNVFWTPDSTANTRYLQLDFNSGLWEEQGFQGMADVTSYQQTDEDTTNLLTPHTSDHNDFIQ